MDKKLLLGLLALILILPSCSNIKQGKLKREFHFNKADKAIREVENKEKNSDSIKRNPIPQVATNLEDALKIYLNHNFGDGALEDINIERLKLELIGDTFTFEIDGFKNGKEYKLRIRDNGEILDEKINDSGDKKYAIDFEKIISGKEAMEIALKNENKGCWVKGYELRIENSKAVYDIDIADGKDIKIEAASGEIIERE